MPRAVVQLSRSLTPFSMVTLQAHHLSRPQEACSSKPSHFLVTWPQFFGWALLAFRFSFVWISPGYTLRAICLPPFGAAGSIWLTCHSTRFTDFLILDLSHHCPEMDEISFHPLFCFGSLSLFFLLSAIIFGSCVLFILALKSLCDCLLDGQKRVHLLCTRNSEPHLLILGLYSMMRFFHYCPDVGHLGTFCVPRSSPTYLPRFVCL